MKRKFLAVTIDATLQELFQNYDGNQTSEVHCIESLSMALDLLMKEPWSLILVDLQLPGINQTEMVRILHQIKHLPILAVTEELQPEEKVLLFRAGVNAFVEKPVNLDACFAQANALVELNLSFEDDINWDAPLTVGESMLIAPRFHRVLINGEPLNLARKEFDLLYYFAKHPGQVFSKEQLYEQVWDNFCDWAGGDTVKTHIQKLRKKLLGVYPNLIETVRGVGYRLVLPG